MKSNVLCLAVRPLERFHAAARNRFADEMRALKAKIEMMQWILERFFGEFLETNHPETPYIPMYKAGAGPVETMEKSSISACAKILFQEAL
jgi:hypothetical protein